MAAALLIDTSADAFTARRLGCTLLTSFGLAPMVAFVSFPVMLVLITIYPTSSRGLRKILDGLSSADPKMRRSMKEAGFYTVRYADLVTLALIVFGVGSVGFVAGYDVKLTPQENQDISMFHSVCFWLMELTTLLVSVRFSPVQLPEHVRTPSISHSSLSRSQCSHAVIWYTTRSEKRMGRRKSSIHINPESTAGNASTANSTAGRTWGMEGAAESTAVGGGTASTGESSMQESSVQESTATSTTAGSSVAVQ